MKRAARVVVWLLLMCAVARASEPSKLLYSRGLVSFHAGKFDEALKLFDKAVEADPTDSYARYYRGVTRARLGNPEGAVSDLRQVLQEKPELNQASLDLGIALVETQHFEEALAPLDQALQGATENDTIAQASLFKGIAEMRLGKREQARESLATALAHDPHLPAAHYYAGVVAYEDGKLDAAQSHFEQVIAARPTSAIGKESTTFMERIHADRGRNYEVFAGVGFQYDSNVILAASNGAIGAASEASLGVSRQSDGRATINLGGYYLLGRTDNARLTVGYEFYQSLHFTLHQFDLQQHQPMGQLEFLFAPFRFGTIVRYDYYLLQWDDFLRQFQAEPYAGLDLGALGQIGVFGRILRRDFLQPGQPKDPANPNDVGQPDYRIRDGWNYAPGASYQYNFFNDPQRSVSVGYQYDSEQPDNSILFLTTSPQRFAYNGNQASAGVSWALPFDVSSTLEYIYRNEDYGPQSAVAQTSGGQTTSGPRRHDAEHHVIVVASREIWEHLTLNVGYFGLFNHSNQAEFEYERQIASISLEARF